ncbi:hypothetical protein [Dictyobacter arantiisoli]|uniref:hypothetical protein n=1 Tax=Dictyobacter arantiisoli TaxID=2014874 RepID=UPI0011EE4D6E|nr:hypothetical protein [Dictyobacter arantiisoli]
MPASNETVEFDSNESVAPASNETNSSHGEQVNNDNTEERPDHIVIEMPNDELEGPDRDDILIDVAEAQIMN